MIIGEDGEYGSVVRYSCNDGYDLIGTPMLVCDSEGWRGSVPSCISKLLILVHFRKIVNFLRLNDFHVAFSTLEDRNGKEM